MRNDGGHGRDGSEFSLQTMCSGPSLILTWEAGSSSDFLCWGKRCGPPEWAAKGWSAQLWLSWKHELCVLAFLGGKGRMRWLTP